jgi:tryptophan synthase beta chain
VTEAHSVSAGLDYPGVGPEHSWLRDSGRAEYTAATDAEALAAFKLTAELEGIIPALESAHALAYVLRGPAQRGPAHSERSTRFSAGDVLIVNLSGRGDKDVHEAATLLGEAP